MPISHEAMLQRSQELARARGVPARPPTEEQASAMQTHREEQVESLTLPCEWHLEQEQEERRDRAWREEVLQKSQARRRGVQAARRRSRIPLWIRELFDPGVALHTRIARVFKFVGQCIAFVLVVLLVIYSLLMQLDIHTNTPAESTATACFHHLTPDCPRTSP